jgi:lipopolysaccharide/colanic/teichoic acid biosynthesis glycosyltransferase
VKPGITGWAQVNGFRGETLTDAAMESRVQADLHYIEAAVMRQRVRAGTDERHVAPDHVQELRQLVEVGLTGWAQVNGFRGETLT